MLGWLLEVSCRRALPGHADIIARSGPSGRTQCLTAALQHLLAGRGMFKQRM